MASSRSGIRYPSKPAAKQPEDKKAFFPSSGRTIKSEAGIPRTEEENAHGQVYRTGRTCVKLRLAVVGLRGKGLGSHMVETAAPVRFDDAVGSAGWSDHP